MSEPFLDPVWASEGALEGAAYQAAAHHVSDAFMARHTHNLPFPGPAAASWDASTLAEAAEGC